MLLYHYSSDKYAQLKTLAKQRKITPEEEEKAHKEFMSDTKFLGRPAPGYYYDHISFFFERVPLDIIADCFDGEHPFWYHGHVLYEHIVDTRDIKHFTYEVVEFPEKTDMFYDSALSDKEYFRKLKKVMLENHYVGKDEAELERAFGHVDGKVSEYYRQVKTRYDYEDVIKETYAATVPHVMLYPIGGIVVPKEVNKVKVK